MDMIFGIEHQRDPAVPLDTRDGIDGDSSEVGLRCRFLFHDGIPLACFNKFVIPTQQV